MPATGHVNPMQPIAAELIRRGHKVTWMTGLKFREKVELTGATFAGLVHTPDFDTIPIESDNGSSGLAAAVYVLRRLFVDRIRGQVSDYEEILLRPSSPVDAIVVDMCSLGAHSLHERHSGKPPYATLGINPLVTFDPEIPSWGSGSQPPKTWVGLMLNRLSHLVGEWLFMSRMTTEVNAVRSTLNLPPLPADSGFHKIIRSPYLHIMPTTEAFEFPRATLEPQVKFVGPLLPLDTQDYPLPNWWSDLKGKKVVHVTQGTYDTNAANLIWPTIEALRDEEVVLVVTSPDATTAFKDSIFPSNVRTASFMPHSKLLPLVDVMVTNAGYNGVLVALTHGVPLICAGRSEDKADVSARVTWCGAGIDLGTDKPSVAAIKTAVNEVLQNSKYREGAAIVRKDFATHNSPVEACDLLEAMSRYQN